MTPYRYHVFFCINEKASAKPCCHRGGSVELFNYAKQRVEALDLKAQGIRVSHSGCLGRCRLGPSVVVYPDNVWYRLRCEPWKGRSPDGE